MFARAKENMWVNLALVERIVTTEYGGVSYRMPAGMSGNLGYEEVAYAHRKEFLETVGKYNNPMLSAKP